MNWTRGELLYTPLLWRFRFSSLLYEYEGFIIYGKLQLFNLAGKKKMDKTGRVKRVISLTSRLFSSHRMTASITDTNHK